MVEKIKKEKWDGRSRPSTDLYKENFDRIFGKKEQDELDESYKQSLKNREERIKKVEDPFGKSVKQLLDEIDEDEMKEIEDRNGF
jgi:predicted transcriptional regulator